MKLFQGSHTFHLGNIAVLSYRSFHVTGFKNLQSLEICGGGLTDAGVKNLKDMVSLTQLNLSQNCNLSDKTLELIAGILSAFVTLYLPNKLKLNKNGLTSVTDGIPT